MKASSLDDWLSGLPPHYCIRPGVASIYQHHDRPHPLDTRGHRLTHHHHISLSPMSGLLVISYSRLPLAHDHDTLSHSLPPPSPSSPTRFRTRPPRNAIITSGTTSPRRLASRRTAFAPPREPTALDHHDFLGLLFYCFFIFAMVFCIGRWVYGDLAWDFTTMTTSSSGLRGRLGDRLED